MKASQAVSRGPMVGIAIASLVGIVLSVYAYYVEISVESDPTFRALCDISSKMSCSKVFSSRYGKGFGLVDRFLSKDSVLNQPNSVFGMINYLAHGLLAFNTSSFALWFGLSTSGLSLVACVYLAYVLFVILEDFCVVCISTYVVNIIITICCVLKYRAVMRQREGRGKQSKQKTANGTKTSNSAKKSNGTKKSSGAKMSGEAKKTK